NWLASLFDWLGDMILRQVTGYRLFWIFALQRYRTALKRKYGKLTISFTSLPKHHLHMRDVYVPLRVAGAGSRELVDAYQAIQKHKWLVVVGAPGAGKTMLLCNLAYTYAIRGLRDFPDQPVPILLELHRLNDSTISLTEHLVEVLNPKKFKDAGRFL